MSEGQRAVEYPYKDVLGCVEGLFLNGSSSREAWRAKLSVLLYYLLDGGWLTAAAPLSQVSTVRQGCTACQQAAYTFTTL